MTRVDQLIKEALLSKDKIALNAYKNLKSELQKALTAKNAPEYSEALFIQVTTKYAKSLEDAILQFSEAHRDDLVSSYTDELEVVKNLLPEPVTAEDIDSFIENDEEFFEQYYITKFIGDNDETIILDLLEKYHVYNWIFDEYHNKSNTRDPDDLEGYDWYLEFVFEDNIIWHLFGYNDYPDTYVGLAREVEKITRMDLLELNTISDEELILFDKFGNMCMFGG